MKKLLALAFLISVLSPLSLRAQECMGVVLKEGGGFEMVSLDKRGKETGRIVYKIKSVTNEGPDVIVDMDFESFDQKGKSQMTSSVQMRCNGNEMRMDASAMMGQDQSKQYEAMDMQFTSKDIIFPAKLSVGQTLPDGSLHGEGGSGPMTMTTDAEFVNRKVVGKESITVPAGTFDVYKITTDMNVAVKSIIKMNIEFNTVSYRADKVLWDVKTETYRKGKLVGSTELSKIF